MTEPLPDPRKPRSILPHQPQDDRDIWEAHEQLPSMPEDDLDEVTP